MLEVKCLRSRIEEEFRRSVQTKAWVQRQVFCEDALLWLEKAGKLPGCSLVTSLPDFSEFAGLTLEGWKDWFVEAASRVLDSCPDEGMAVFYQTDIRHQGHWVDKAYLLMKAAERQGLPLLWHKVVCRVPPGCPLHSRAGYAHLLCFSPALKPNLQRASADVLAQTGSSTWSRGMGLEVCRFIVRQLIRQSQSHTVVAPFCGHGLLLSVANAHGLRAIGIERNKKRAKLALENALESRG